MFISLLSYLFLMVLEKKKERQCKQILPYTFVPFDNGVKYLGFHLKPNDYRFRDWL